MRTEKEILDLILTIAKGDQRIRAVYMNGSRVNSAIEKDIYQDYDIVYVVTETESFLADRDWLANFGEPAMVQEPDSKDFGWGQDADYSRSYSWLMLFKDGSRIDLKIQTIRTMQEEYPQSTLTEPLLDKDNILPVSPPSSDSGYLVKEPEKSQYYGCCNEFWWCLNGVAKGIVRDQIPYAMRMYYETVHCELDKMLTWYIGIETNFSVNVGKWGRYFKKYLSAELYGLYTRTYANYGDLWRAIFATTALFRTVADRVGKHFGYEYNINDDANMMQYLFKMKGADDQISIAN